MKINTQFIDIKHKGSLAAFIEKKFTQKITEKYSDIITAEVFLKEENDPSPKGKICEIKLHVPGPDIFASSNEESFEAAIVETINDLEKQLRKRKGKLRPYL